MKSQIELDDSERRVLRLMTEEERETFVDQKLEQTVAELEWTMRLAVAKALSLDTMELALDEVELVPDEPAKVAATPRPCRPDPSAIVHRSPRQPAPIAKAGARPAPNRTPARASSLLSLSQLRRPLPSLT